MSGSTKGIFRSLRSVNYRIWAIGALVSNVGTWMQRTAQDWLVLTQLTHHNATAVGIVMGLQFGPQLLLLPISGYLADHFDKRKLLIITQAALGVLALALGILHRDGMGPPVGSVCLRLPIWLHDRVGCTGTSDLHFKSGGVTPICQMPWH